MKSEDQKPSNKFSTNGATAPTVDGDVSKDKKNFSGIHSTGFRFVLPLVVINYGHLTICLIFSQGLLVES